MENFETLRSKRIFITGHSGFTGSWASIWLKQLGAEVYGYSLEPETKPNLFVGAKLPELVNGEFNDILDLDALKASVSKFKPDLILHLAAQPLVRRSYRIPQETFAVNALGTANVLEAAMAIDSVKGIVCITTDKVYKNNDSGRPFVESDELGGRDPYSASKAAAEIVIASYRDSFNNELGNLPPVAVARGGNIIGGGDWSEDRLIPDYVRALDSGVEFKVRHPEATRPWQHVIALVEGYIRILAGLASENAPTFNKAFNLGPRDNEVLTVAEVVTELERLLPGVAVEFEKSPWHEAGKLSLNSGLALEALGWQSKWTAKEAIDKTAEWYREFNNGQTNARELCLRQIESWNAS